MGWLGQVVAKGAETAIRAPLEKLGIRTHYSRKFYDTQRAGSEKSAQKILPHVMELVQPRSVLDIGCGEGYWLGVFQKLGVQDVTGVDGDYVDRSRLAFPADRFVPYNLNTLYKAPRRYDLSMSVETGEHIAPENSETLVRTLTDAAPVVMFSAAIPFQGGRNHINERWPSFWIDLFAKHGFDAMDAVRGQVWDDPDVEFWYIQNIFLFVQRSERERFPRLIEAARRHAFPSPNVVHPRCFLQAVRWGWTRKSITTTYANGTTPGMGKA